MTAPWYFEDIPTSEVVRTKGRTVTETDLMNFIGLSGIYEEHYLNVQYARESSVFGRRFIPGALTFVLAEGLAVQTGLLEGTGLALLEVNVRFVAPVVVGDTIHVTMQAKHKRLSTSNPERGIVKFAHRVINQDEDCVMEMSKTRLMRCRPLAEPM